MSAGSEASGRVRSLHPAALLNGVMDRYADLLAFVQVTAKVEHPELERHVTAFFEASQQVQAVLRPDQYGPGAPTFEEGDDV